MPGSVPADSDLIQQARLLFHRGRLVKRGQIPFLISDFLFLILKRGLVCVMLVVTRTCHPGSQ